MKMALIPLEGQHLSMRFLKSQLLCSKIKTDGGSSRNLGSASFKNENQEERLKFNYLTCSFEKDFVRQEKTTENSKLRTLSRKQSSARTASVLPRSEILKHPNCDASNQSTLRNVLGVQRIWNLEISFRNERDNEET